MRNAKVIAAVLLVAAAGALWREHGVGSGDGPTHVPALTVAAVAIAMPYDQPSNAQRIVRDLQFNFPVALDLSRRAADAFGGVEAIPRSFLIAPDGRIARRIVAGIEAEKVREQIAAWVGA